MLFCLFGVCVFFFFFFNDTATTEIYTRVHSEALSKAASKAAASLQTAKTKPALEPKLRRLASLAGEVSADLKRLGHASKQEQSAIARRLETAAKELG